MKDPFKKFMQDEMDREAEKIEKEVMQNKDLDQIEVPPEMYDRIWKMAEEEKARRQDTEDRYQNLSEEEREWLRRGRELANKGTKGSVVVKKRGKSYYKVLVLAATMAIMLFAAGVTAVGGPQHFVEWLEQQINGRKLVQVDSEKEGEQNVESGLSEEEKAYQDIKDEFGFDAVRMLYLPEGTMFDGVVFQKEANTARLMYKIGDKYITYVMNASYRKESYSYDIEDALQQEYIVNVNGINVIIKEYELTATEERKFAAQFEYKDISYFLSASISQDKFEKIIENLKFF